MADFEVPAVDSYDPQISSSSGAGPSNHVGQQYGQSQPETSAPSSYTFRSPTRPTNYSDWKREEELRQNVASMFDFVEPRVQRFGDETSLRTERAVVDDSDVDESGTQTPKPKAQLSHWKPTSAYDVERQMIEQVCRDSRWPEEKESRPSTPKPFPGELPDEMAFLSRYPRIGEATVTYLRDDGTKDKIENLHRQRMAQTCELIGFVFEAESRPGNDRCHLDMLTERIAKPFVRFLHIQSYALNDEEGRNAYDDAPTSLLIHIELCRVGQYFDLKKLVQESYVNIQRQCEFSCSSPKKPIDLESAILYLYKYRKDFAEYFERIMDTFANYCVACFYANRLGADPEFKKLARENNDFYHRLYENSMRRNDGIDVTPGIVQLPYEHMMPTERPLPRDLFNPVKIPEQIRGHLAQNAAPPEPVGAASQLAIHGNLELRFKKAPASTPSVPDQIQALWDQPESPRKRRAGSDTIKAIQEQLGEEEDADEKEDDDDVWGDVIQMRKHVRVTNPVPVVEEDDRSNAEPEFEHVRQPAADDVVALSSAENTDVESDWENVPMPRVRWAQQDLPVRSWAHTWTVQQCAVPVDMSESDSEWSDVGRESAMLE